MPAFSALSSRRGGTRRRYHGAGPGAGGTTICAGGRCTRKKKRPLSTNAASSRSEKAAPSRRHAKPHVHAPVEPTNVGAEVGPLHRRQPTLQAARRDREVQAVVVGRALVAASPGLTSRPLPTATDQSSANCAPGSDSGPRGPGGAAAQPAHSTPSTTPTLSHPATLELVARPPLNVPRRIVRPTSESTLSPCRVIQAPAPPGVRAGLGVASAEALPCGVALCIPTRREERTEELEERNRQRGDRAPRAPCCVSSGPSGASIGEVSGFRFAHSTVFRLRCVIFADLGGQK